MNRTNYTLTDIIVLATTWIVVGISLNNNDLLASSDEEPCSDEGCEGEK